MLLCVAWPVRAGLLSPRAVVFLAKFLASRLLNAWPQSAAITPDVRQGAFVSVLQASTYPPQHLTCSISEEFKNVRGEGKLIQLKIATQVLGYWKLHLTSSLRSATCSSHSCCCCQVVGHRSCLALAACRIHATSCNIWNHDRRSVAHHLWRRLFTREFRPRSCGNRTGSTCRTSSLKPLAV